LDLKLPTVFGKNARKPQGEVDSHGICTQTEHHGIETFTHIAAAILQAGHYSCYTLNSITYKQK